MAPKLFFDPGWFHNATLGPLEHGRRYYYRYGEVGGLQSAIHTFVAPPKPISTFSILYTADVGLGSPGLHEHGSATHNSMNVDQGNKVIEALANAGAPDMLWLINGDLSYANGWLWMWERWMDLITPLSSTLPMAVTMGNHEYDFEKNTAGAPYAVGTDSGGECGIPTQTRFHMKPGSEDWYSFNYGPLHIVMMNSESNITMQRDWVIADMASVDRTATPWTIVLMHRPMYGSYNLDLDRKAYAIKLFGELFGTLGVDIVFTAHEHYYERMRPIHGVTYIIDGVGGRNDFDPDDSLPYAKTAYVEFQQVGYTRLVVNGSTTLSVQHYHVDGTMTDSVTLTK
jgi:hypothetical protein